MKKYSTENAKEPFPAAQWQIEGSSDWIWEGGGGGGGGALLASGRQVGWQLRPLSDKRPKNPFWIQNGSRYQIVKSCSLKIHHIQAASC